MALSASRYQKLKWLSIAGSILALSFLVVSLFYRFGYVAKRFQVSCGAGQFVLHIASASFPYPGWSGNRYKPFRFDWKPKFIGGIAPKGAKYTINCFLVPFWIPTLIAGVAAVYFHRKARIPGPGHCIKCGYNLTGNTSGVCPECGVGLRHNETE